MAKKTFQNLIRLHEWQVDEKRRALGDLLKEVGALEDQARRLEQELENEQRIARSSATEAGIFYGTYANTVIDRREKIAEAIAAKEVEVEAAREELREAYRDLKKYEVVEEARKKREEEELARKEQAFLDEIGTQRHVRRRQR